MKRILRLNIFLAILFLYSQIAVADRVIIVNGKQLSPEEIVYIDQMACATVEDGDYWLDPATGGWGFRGDPTMRGRLLGQCDQSTADETLAENNSKFQP